MRIKFIALFLLIFLSYQARSQDYLVTLQRDTVTGDIDILLPDALSESIVINSAGEKTRYKAYQFITAYIDSSFYRPVKLGDKYRLMKVVKDGYLSLMLFRPDNSYEFGSQYLLKKTLEGLEISNIGFRKRVTEYLKECPELVAKIDEKVYKKADLLTIVDAFNGCLESKTEERYVEAEAESQPEAEPTQDVRRNAQTTIGLIDAIKSKIPENQSELHTLLADIKTKLTNEQPVPSYLIGALKDQTRDMVDIQEDVQELIGQIKSDK